MTSLRIHKVTFIGQKPRLCSAKNCVDIERQSNCSCNRRTSGTQKNNGLNKRSKKMETSSDNSSSTNGWRRAEKKTKKKTYKNVRVFFWNVFYWQINFICDLVTWTLTSSSMTTIKWLLSTVMLSWHCCKAVEPIYWLATAIMSISPFVVRPAHSELCVETTKCSIVAKLFSFHSRRIATPQETREIRMI